MSGPEPLRRRHPAPPVRIAHLGLGAFHRAHQAWWTGEVSDWGIAAFGGRHAELARALSDQDGLYTLVVRGDDDDDMSLVSSLALTAGAGDAAAWTSAMASPTTSLVTLTVTEGGYRLRPGGGLDLDAADVAADLEALRAGDPGSAMRTIPGRLLAGLAARRAAGTGGVAVVPCDNLADNGPAVRRALLDGADAVDAGLAEWIRDEVSVVSTVVDRITPATTDADRALVAERTGRADAAPVVTEPWREWVLCGDFPAGRPPWEAAGARFVDDVGPWADRKLRLLNGGHSLLAYLGSAVGHDTVAEACADPWCRAWLDAWWAEATPTLTAGAGPAAEYCRSLVGRFATRRIAYRLDQVAAGGGGKLPQRVGPVLGVAPSPAALATVSGWMAWLRSPAGARDPHAHLARGEDDAAARRVLGIVAPPLADDADAARTVAAGARALGHTGERARVMRAFGSAPSGLLGG